jgi:iron complex outermembrane receptor protein
MAGVILVEPAPLPDSTGLGGEWTVAGASNGRMGISSGRLEGRLAALPLAWRVQGTFKQGGNLQAPGYYLENTGIRENNYSLTLGYHTARRGMEVYYSQFRTRLGILSPAHTGSIRDLEAAIARTIPLGADTVDFTYALRRPYQEVSHHLLKWSGYLRSDRLGSLRTTYAFQQNLRLEYDKHRPRGTDATGADLPELNFLLFTHTLETTWDKTYRGWSLTAGAAGLYQNNQLDGRPFIPNFVVIGGESFVIAYGVREKWSWEAGIRYDYRWLNSAREERGVDIYQVRTYQSLSGTLGLHRHLSRDLRITLNAGTAWRPPHVNELFSDGVHHGAAAYERGDSTLLPEQALMIQAALLWQRPRFSAELTPYLNVFSNFIYLQPDGLEVTIRGTFPAFQYSQTPALLTGADLSLGWQILPSLRYKTKASWLYAQNLGTQTPLALMPANRMSHNLTWTWPGVGSMTDTYLGLGMTAVAAQRRFPADQDLLNPPDGYTLLDAEAGTSLHWRAYCLRIALTGQNLLNTTYRDYLNRFRYFADEPGRNLSLRLTLML